MPLGSVRTSYTHKQWAARLLGRFAAGGLATINMGREVPVAAGVPPKVTLFFLGMRRRLSLPISIMYYFWGEGRRIRCYGGGSDGGRLSSALDWTAAAAAQAQAQALPRVLLDGDGRS